jgi:S-DNA-T family DNA segregation ATPase FtsK/SpoIIIE
MAKSAPQIRRSATPVKAVRWTGLGATFDAAVLIVAVLAAALVLGLSLEARSWMLTTLAFGWIPVGLWAAAATIVLRYRPRLLFRYWRWWLASAGLVAISIGTLSFFTADLMLPGLAVRYDASLGGLWGGVLAGYPLPLGVAKLAAVALVMPLLMYPRWTGGYYFKAARGLGACFWLGIRGAGQGGYRAARNLAFRIGLLFNRRRRRRWMGQMGRALNQAFSARPRRPAAQSKTVTPAVAAGEDAGPAEAPPWDDPPEADWAAADPFAASSNSRETVAAMPPVKSQWKLPSTSLLAPPEPYSVPQSPLQQMARHIETTLAEHGVTVEVKDIKAGPRIVRFGLVPGWVPKRAEYGKKDGSIGDADRSRVKVQSILTREKDLALALKTPYLRIEAPVPGEALVGLEVPNPSPGKVPIRKVMEVQSFASLTAKGGLPIALGEDTGGNAVVMDLAALPHVLIAGATGSGKSVCINSIVASLLFVKPPDQLRMLMVDPKRVELTPFNGIPHLIAPVIVDVEEVNPALRALMREMFRRYKLMEEVGTRNIAGYNAKCEERMPYLVLVVDELADLMMVGGFEIEQNLVRLAQLGRATGIHLVLATQRPSVNVVTGLLKANIPARVAFAVASQVDSRVILDTVGAEKLLGKGDMLLLNNDSPKPRRVQGTLVLDEEVDQVVEFWLNQQGPPLPVISIEDLEDDAAPGDDIDTQMLERARDLALHNPHLSSSFLERRLKIGRQKAEQIVELLEEEGLVIPRL